MTYPSGGGEEIEMKEMGEERKTFREPEEPAWVEWAERPAAPFSETLDDNLRSAKIHESLRSSCLFIIALVMIGMALVYLQYVMVALILARGIVYIFEPSLKFLVGERTSPGARNCCLPRSVAVVIVGLMLLLVVVLLCVVCFFSVRIIVQNADTYVGRIDHLNNETIALIMSFGYSQESAVEMMPSIEWKDLIFPVIEFLYFFFPTALLVIVLSMYMIVSYDPTLVKSDSRHDIDQRIRKYIIIHSAVSLATGILTGITLLIFKSNLWLLLGLLAFLLNYIPNIGSTLAVFIPTILQILDPDVNWLLVFLTFSTLAAIQFVFGQIIEPRILGKVLDVPPLTILVCLLFWGSIWGIVGAIMSVPLTVSIKLYLETIDHPLTQFLAGAIVGEFRDISEEMPTVDMGVGVAVATPTVSTPSVSPSPRVSHQMSSSSSSSSSLRSELVNIPSSPSALPIHMDYYAPAYSSPLREKEGMGAKSPMGKNEKPEF